MTDRATQSRAARPPFRAIPLLACVLACSVFARSSWAQAVGPSHTRVVLAMVTGLPETSGDDIALVRRAPGAPDTVLLRSNAADSSALTAAVFKLLATRQLMGSIVARPVSVRVPWRAVPTAWATGDVQTAAAAAIRRLRATPPQVLPGLGLAYVTTIAVTNRPILTGVRAKRDFPTAHVP